MKSLAFSLLAVLAVALVAGSARAQDRAVLSTVPWNTTVSLDICGHEMTHGVTMSFMDYTDDSCMFEVRHGPAKAELSVASCDARYACTAEGVVFEVRSRASAFVERDVGGAALSVYEIDGGATFNIEVDATSVTMRRITATTQVEQRYTAASVRMNQLSIEESVDTAEEVARLAAQHGVRSLYDGSVIELHDNVSLTVVASEPTAPDTLLGVMGFSAGQDTRMDSLWLTFQATATETHREPGE